MKPKKSMNKNLMALASFVLALVGWGIYPLTFPNSLLLLGILVLLSSWTLSIIFGANELKKLKKNKNLKKKEIIKVKVFAIAGLILSLLGLVLVFLLNFILGFIKGLVKI
jgi:polyferredoxin